MKKVILVNLGGPRNLSEIEKFLTDLFTDPYIFDLPLPKSLQRALGKFIAKKRVPKVQHAYENLNYGGGSPLVDETIKQAKKLEEKLKQISNQDWQIEVKMTCGFPNLRDLKISLDELGKTTFILPLYPQYSRSTTLSTLKILQKLIGVCPVAKEDSCTGESCINKCKIPELKIKGWINPFYKNQDFIDASSSLIVDFFCGKLQESNFIQLETPPEEDWKNIPILFSAHGIPMRLVQKGDPYPQQVEETKDLIVSNLRQKGYQAETFLSY
ncbi:MAG: ferrochelatase, partial [Leptospiraceae bacterium]|nr:ferrochelatase [Leptospiraceae bacterium]